MRSDLERILEVKRVDSSFERSYCGRFRRELNPLFLEGGPHGFKIRSPGEAPAVRLDFDAQHKKPENHIQYGDELFTGRSGNEAVEMFVDLFVSNPNISMPPLPNLFLPRPPGKLY